MWRPDLRFVLDRLVLSAFFIAALIIVSRVCVAAPQDYAHRIWGTEQGLPESRIQAISQTSDGYLWIGTPAGLVRFDGVRFVTFDRANTPAFRDDNIRALCPSKDGSLWIGTTGGGLIHYRNGSFQAFGSESGLSNGFVRAIHEDRRGNLWVGTDRGFFRVAGDRAIRLDGNAAVPYAAVGSIYEDRAGQVWLGGSKLFRIAEGQLIEYPYRGGGLVPYVTSIQEARDGKLWLAAGGRLNLLINDARVRVSPRGLPSGISASIVREGRDGTLWIGSLGGGLVRLGEGQSVVYSYPDILPDNTILSFFEDRDGNLWIGTQDGLVRFSRSSVTTISRRDGLLNESVSAIYQDRSQTLWIIAETGRIYRYSDGRLSPFFLPEPVRNSRVQTIIEDRSGALWFGTVGEGAIHLKNGKVTVYTTREGLRQNSIRAFLEDRQGNLWIATGSGLNKWDGSRFASYYVDDGLSYGGTRALLEDRSGAIWIGTDRGMSVFLQGKFQPNPVVPELANEKIWALHEDLEGALWMGTQGLGLFRLKNGKLAHFTVREGISQKSIHSITEDKNGRLWMSGPAGIFSVARRDLDAVADGKLAAVSLSEYGTAEGLISNQMSGGVQPAGCLAVNGMLWFPSVKGAVVIDPSVGRPESTLPVHIEELVVDDQPLAPGKISIPAGRGRLEIHYTAVNLRAPERVRFKYKLDGFDRMWSAPSPRRAAYYTGLPPGDYRFRVMATEGSAQAGSEASVAFTWQPHFYQTQWFYAACVLCCAALLWLLFRLWAHQTQARYKLVLEERTRLAREMHDTVIQGCVGVSTLLEAASSVQERDPQRMKDLLDRAKSQVKLTLDEARQAMWDLRHNTAGGEVASVMPEFAAQFSKERNIPIETSISGTPAALDQKTDRHLFLVAREAVRNAVVHAKPKQIKIHFLFEPGELRMEILDDGCGFNPREKLRSPVSSYGLVGMRERMEQLGGWLSFESNPGQGTKVVACLPLRRTEGMQSGS